mmetsp:Transcript_38686/g.93537  ORF Transcript_38686/g.93537 Transcript_38686/m.93537 type:complete len:92 (-) Transcript_38686:102-377(-)
MQSNWENNSTESSNISNFICVSFSRSYCNTRPTTGREFDKISTRLLSKRHIFLEQESILTLYFKLKTLSQTMNGDEEATRRSSFHDIRSRV